MTTPSDEWSRRATNISAGARRRPAASALLVDEQIGYRNFVVRTEAARKSSNPQTPRNCLESSESPEAVGRLVQNCGYENVETQRRFRQQLREMERSLTRLATIAAQKTQRHGCPFAKIAFN